MDYLETNDQFLARMLIATRENDQLSSADARRLNDMARFGRPAPAEPQRTTTMPEERRGAQA